MSSEDSITVKPDRLKLATISAFVCAILLSTTWAYREWAPLSSFRLPDNDDMMRLAQVRDWLNGQAFADLSQHRLGAPGGTSMHWSRIADIGPAAIILVLRPLLGEIVAEQAMLILYPALLFLSAILMTTRIVARLAPQAVIVSVIVSALAFPAASLFIPGRIDHHGLQIALTLWFVERLVAPAGWRAGAGAGVAAALSLAIGLETLPLVLFGMAALVVRFTIDPPRVTVPLLTSFAISLGGATLLFLYVLHPIVWPRTWCDGFTPASTSATLIAASYFGLIGMAGSKLTDWRARLCVAGVLGIMVLPILLHTSSICLSGPYGSLDPILQTLWMDKVGEALGLLQQDSWGVAFSFSMFGFVGLGALGLELRAGVWRNPAWRSFAIVFTLGVLLTIFQIRATYIVSGLAAIPIAATIYRVRATSTALWVRVGVWVLGAGVTYDVGGVQIDRLIAPHVNQNKTIAAYCTSPDQIAALGRLPRGRILAPLDLGAYLLGGTHHAVVAAPYHRNNTGNLAMYRFFLGPVEGARAIASQWDATYVVLCRSSFAELGPRARKQNMLFGRLITGTPPPWLTPIPQQGGTALVFAVEPSVPAATNHL